MVLLLRFLPHFALKMPSKCHQMPLFSQKIKPELNQIKLYSAKNSTEIQANPTTINQKKLDKKPPEQ